jgi:outer membrane beta-barrel protein
VRQYVPALFLLVSLAWAPAPTFAARTDLTNAPPIRSAMPLRADRHQVGTHFGFTVNDAYRQSLMAGLSYRYFFNNWLGVGIDFLGSYLSLESDLSDQIETQLSDVGRTRKPATSSLAMLGGLGVTLVPFTGKFMLVGQIPVTYDVHFIAGGGFASTKGHDGIDDTFTWAPMVGLGVRMFASNWIAVELGVRDYVFKMPLVAPADKTVPAVSFEQNFMVTIGVSFFFPPELEQEL